MSTGPKQNLKTVEVVDLNSYAAKKSVIGAALNLSLFSSNTDQLAKLLNDSNWEDIDIVNLSLLIMSLGLQVRKYFICYSKN